jgi:hypothetical protein
MSEGNARNCQAGAPPQAVARRPFCLFMSATTESQLAPGFCSVRGDAPPSARSCRSAIEAAGGVPFGDLPSATMAASADMSVSKAK